MESSVPEGLRYEFGNEHSPTSPDGRVVLTLAGDGAARVENHRRGRVRAWTARVEPTALNTLADRLGAAGFPDAPRISPPAGSTLRLLSAPGASATVVLPWHEARRLPGYGPLFGVLDSLVHQITGGAVRLPDELPPAVRDVREEPGPDH